MLCIIPARGGSKGIPRKNLRRLGDATLVAHAVRCAAETPGITRILVSTDDEEIADEGRRAGAEVPFLRPVELASDTATAKDAYLHVCAELEARGSAPIARVVVLQPTSPLRLASDVQRAIDELDRRDANAVITVSPAPHPITWMMRVNEDGVLRPYADVAIVARNRQEEDIALVPNGVAFVFRRDFLAACISYLSERTFAVTVPRERAIDIDEELDLTLAELLYRKRTTT
ncbi:MAG: acylneuraminate cytidylyltransferase family protein [Myxococcota bacterium]|nr:acylneuraminate cytidylyltransferase family protein [Myxococcota bacterium]